LIWDGMEKRRFVRANVPCKIIIYVPQEHVIVTKTENIGAGGLRVLIPERLQPSSVSSLEFFLDKAAITCRGRVVWIIENTLYSAGEKRAYDTGFEFCDISPRDVSIVSSFVDAIINKNK
jgi:c-di-GMP-binding flagellar brake protein YcgR